MASQEEDSQFKCTCKAGFNGTRCEGTETSKTTSTSGQQFFPYWYRTRPSTINCKRICLSFPKRVRVECSEGNFKSFENNLQGVERLFIFCGRRRRPIPNPVDDVMGSLHLVLLL